MLDRLQKDVSLSSYATFGIGGNAAFFLTCQTIDDLKQGVAWAKEQNLPFLVIGHGSNCLFSDQGFPGIILHNALQYCSHDGSGFFTVGSGYSFPLLGIQTVREGWSGLEFAAGIPGSVGGALFMNAGAHGQEVASSLVFVDVLDGENVKRIFKNEIDFGYRFSSFQKNNAIIVGAGFQLQKDDSAVVRQQEILAQRKKTQPYKERSAGCVFRNPPGYSAGKLIEEAGLKGTRIGGAEISSVHANFIINTGEATAAEVKALIDLIQSTIFKEKKISLHCEVRLI